MQFRVISKGRNPEGLPYMAQGYGFVGRGFSLAENFDLCKGLLVKGRSLLPSLSRRGGGRLFISFEFGKRGRIGKLYVKVYREMVDTFI